MTNSENVYDVTEKQRHPDGTSYFFISEGERNIVKVVQYAYIGIKQDRLIYNLGFGTYNPINDTIQDDEISANGDTYKVFNTVLSTIPDFLNNFPGVMVMVTGSDSTSSYPENCRPNCKKKCIPPTCKNANRRICIYKNFINKNFDQLSKEYIFTGGLQNTVYQQHTEIYRINNNYDRVFFIKK